LDPDSAFYIISIVFLLVLSAIFSGSEVAFFSINNLLKEKLAKLSSKRAQNVLKLVKNPRKLLISILIGNTLVNVTLASFAAILLMQIADTPRLSPQMAVLINVVVITFVILVVSEITPKILALKNPLKIALNLSFFILLCYYLVLPITFVLAKVTDYLIKILHLKESEKESRLQSREFQALLELGEEQGELEQEEKELIHHIFEFGGTSVREIMVPRIDMICVDFDTTILDLLSVIKSKGHTRIPVFNESIDKIGGIINAKDLLPFMGNSTQKPDLLKMARPAMFVPESKKIDDLLRNFQSEQQHMAIVVDEYGGTSGLVTLEDVIEEIVGEIRDEYDKEQSLYQKIDDKTTIVDAKIDIESLNELINIDLPDSDDYDTLGGFILENIGSLPEDSQIIEHGDFEMVMEKVEKNRIVSIKIIHNPKQVETDKK
jgi:putative hemolysin